MPAKPAKPLPSKSSAPAPSNPPAKKSTKPPAASPAPAKKAAPSSQGHDGSKLADGSHEADEDIAARFGMSVEELRDVRGLFEGIDTDGGGEIDATELRELLGTLGRKVTEEQTRKMIAEVDTDGGGTVGFEEFLTLIARESAAQRAKDPVVEARKVFDKFDKVPSVAPCSFARAAL